VKSNFVLLNVFAH